MVGTRRFAPLCPPHTPARRPTVSPMQKITPFLWFDGKAEQAANFYCSVFDNSRVLTASRYGEAGAKAAGVPAGTAMVVEFELAGQKFSAINGGPHFKFSPAV